MPAMKSIPLRFACLCLEDDCEAIFPLPARDGACPACASRAVWPLARWLNTNGCKPLTFYENALSEAEEGWVVP